VEKFGGGAAGSAGDNETPDNLYPWSLARDRPFPSRARFAAVGDGKC